VLVCAFLVASPAGAAPALHPQPQVEVTGATLVEFDDATGVWVLRGQPVVIRRDPIVVRADLVRYDTKQQLVSASSGVSYRDNVVEVFAGTVAVWILRQQAIAEGDVNAVYHGPEQVRLAAARVELSGRPGEATASGKAVLTHRRGTLTAEQITYDDTVGQAIADGGATAETDDGTLRADRVVASLPRQELVADGNVLITGRDLEGRAARAELNQQAGSFDLSGDAMVRMTTRVFRANRIAVDVRARRVTASGGVHVIAQP
jgi:lipopolysaccharide export system protein LptA